MSAKHILAEVTQIASKRMIAFSHEIKLHSGFPWADYIDIVMHLGYGVELHISRSLVRSSVYSCCIDDGLLVHAFYAKGAEGLDSAIGAIMAYIKDRADLFDELTDILQGG